MPSLISTPCGRLRTTSEPPCRPCRPAATALYADVVFESGFPQTLVDTVTIPEGTGPQVATAIAPDLDDSWHVAEPLTAPAVGPKIAKLEGGGTMQMESGAARRQPRDHPCASKPATPRAIRCPWSPTWEC